MKRPACHTSNPRENQLLAALTSAESTRWLPALEPVALPIGMVLCETGCSPTYAYFPTTAIVSLLNVTEDGESSEVAVVGNDYRTIDFAALARFAEFDPTYLLLDEPSIHDPG